MSQWLRRRPGVTDVRFVGDEGDGPPDFLARFRGGHIAVEATKMPLESGWSEKYRIAFERELSEVVQSVKDDPRAPRWHVLCSYDPRQPKPPRRKGGWRRCLKRALTSPGSGGKLQLIEERWRVGAGVVVKYFPAGNDGSLPVVNEAGAYLIVGTASERIVEEIRKKAAKIRNSPSAPELPRAMVARSRR